MCQGGELCDLLGGSAAGVCPAGSYCVAGEVSVVCPFKSTSKEGSDSIDDCVCELGLSLLANTYCGRITEQVASPSFWTAGAIAGVVVGGVVVFGVAVAVGVVLWVGSGGVGGGFTPMVKAVSAPNLGTELMKNVLSQPRK